MQLKPQRPSPFSVRVPSSRQPRWSREGTSSRRIARTQDQKVRSSPARSSESSWQRLLAPRFEEARRFQSEKSRVSLAVDKKVKATSLNSQIGDERNGGEGDLRRAAELRDELGREIFGELVLKDGGSDGDAKDLSKGANETVKSHLRWSYDWVSFA